MVLTRVAATPESTRVRYPTPVFDSFAESGESSPILLIAGLTAGMLAAIWTRSGHSSVAIVPSQGPEARPLLYDFAQESLARCIRANPAKAGDAKPRD